MHKTSRAMRSVTFAAIFGLALTTGAVGAPVASAQEESPVETAKVSTIDVNKKASLTIHKKGDPVIPEGQDKLPDATGNEAVVSGHDLEGVEFTIQKVNGVDLTTNEGLAAAAGLTVDSAKEKGLTRITTNENGVKKTGDDGKVVFSGLDLGVYLVTETGPKDGYSPASPFLVFLPMTQNNAEAGGTEWNYDVVAYPKNYKNELVKEVVDADKNVADTVLFNVTANVPKKGDKGKVTKFHIIDNIEVEQTDSAKVESVKIGETPLTKDVDYKVLDETVVNIDGKDHRHLVIEFLQPGLTQLENNQDAKVVATFSAEVAKVGNTDGVLHNVAKSISNNGNGDGDVETPSNPTNSYWGKVRINKFEAGGENAEKDGKKLEGAIFEVYKAKNGTCGESKADLGEKIIIDGKSEWTTDKNGEALIDGLHVTDIENNDKQIEKMYCLLETKSPAGYELLAKPIEITMKHDELQKLGDDVQPVSVQADVPNLKDTTPNLPLTGGAGIGILAAIGAALVGLGAWFARRNSQEA